MRSHVNCDLVRRRMSVKHLAGIVLILTSEQAYAHSFLIEFPNQGPSSQILIPLSGLFLVSGLLLAVWGLWSD